MHSVEVGRLVGGQLRHLQVVHQEARRRNGVQNLAKVVHRIRLNQRQRPASPRERRRSVAVGEFGLWLRLEQMAEQGVRVLFVGSNPISLCGS
jgi:hypothetical protein